MPQSEDDHERFREDIRSRSRQLEQLMRSLSGRFAPKPALATRADKPVLQSGEGR
jgi:hypothetical protein